MPYNVSKFAKSQLHQSGWVEGKGLGRNEDGMSEAIKVKIKADTAGIGHDPAEQFTFHWWEHAFKKSAQNIKVTEDEAGVAVEAKSETDKASTRKQNKKLMREKLLYGSFVKSGILEDGKVQSTKNPGESSSDSSDSESENSGAKKSKILTDEELLAACGGRTAHKGARHGMKLSAKLARLQEQEKVELSETSKSMKKKKKSKKKKAKQSNCDTKLGVTNGEKDETNSETHEASRTDITSCPLVVKESSKKAKKKKRKSEEKNENPGQCVAVKTKKRKKRKISLTEIERTD